jgi:putative transposase
MQADQGHKKIRLPLQVYAEPGTVWHITICTHGRVAAFGDNSFAAEICDQIGWYGRKYGVTIHAYCLMPDHLHAIAQVHANCLLSMLGAFKSFTTRLWWRNGGAGPLWQKSFHDHGIRQIDDFDAAVQYLFENPQRAGLVDEWSMYPWRGGAYITGDEM